MADKKAKEEVKSIEQGGKSEEKPQGAHLPAIFTPRLIGLLADEIAKIVIKHIPFQQTGQPRKKKSNGKKTKKIDYAVFFGYLSHY